VNYALLIVVAAACGALGYWLGARRGRSGAAVDAPAAPQPVPLPAVPTPAPPPAAVARPDEPGPLDGERHRLLRAAATEATLLRRGLADRDARIAQLETLAEERHALFDALAGARADTARYRQLVVDIETNAPPVLFGTAAPDDLKLIVGVGPVLERLLHQLGVTSYRQIARWTERDIDEFDRRLAEFPGRIRRDGWVTQARALHESKFGSPAAGRDRG
jgi:predicted flap endonuclease-1-like 5' DNA nuclease